MLTYWETLVAIQSNVPVNDSYAQLWGRKSQGGYTVVTYVGTLPAVLTGTKAGYLHRYKVYGNTEQIGTPTPENPIVPQECGELETTGIHAGQYKLPLTSAGQDVDIYLGESQTTRRIKKLVLTGEETFVATVASTHYRCRTSIVPKGVTQNVTSVISTHYFASAGARDGSITLTADGGSIYFTDDTNAVTAETFKSYLAAQYANGTPVTVWYVLATEETGTLNEPLRKIGDYADTIDSTQTNAQIPTSAASTTISWAGEGLAPSQVELKYEKKR